MTNIGKEIALLRSMTLAGLCAKYAAVFGEGARTRHKDFLIKLKYARIWGKSVHDGMMVQRDHVMQDGDIVEIHI